LSFIKRFFNVFQRNDGQHFFPFGRIVGRCAGKQVIDEVVDFFLFQFGAVIECRGFGQRNGYLFLGFGFGIHRRVFVLFQQFLHNNFRRRNIEYPRSSANNECIFVDNPRLEYALILNYILRKRKKKKKYYKELENRIIIGENVNIGKEANIEPFVFIDHDVQIGDYCTLKSGARICSNVSIENNTIIGQNSVIGGPGFGIEKDNEGNLIRIPHIGGVIIGNNVEIDALTTIDSGTIEPTVIEDNVMINNHVHIAHNVYIEKNSIITGCCNISGSVHIKRDTWLGPNCPIKNGITIGKNVLVGMGAVVRKSTKDNVVLAGNPAKEIHK